jgi:hypothetical protein
MKLRLTALHYEKYTGQMGITDFVDGLSTADVLPNVGARMAAVMNCEWEDGTAANVGQVYMDNLHMQAPVESEQKAKAQEEEEVAKAYATKLPTYTEEQLGTIADEEGIAGLRTIAEPFGLKSNSIGGLIELIVKAGISARAE